MAGIDFAQRVDDDGFGGAVDFGDEVVLLFDADFELIDVATGAADQFAGVEGGLDGRVEHGMHGSGGIRPFDGKR